MAVRKRTTRSTSSNDSGASPLSRGELFSLCAAILHHAPVGEAEQEVERVIGMPLDEPTRATLEYIATPKGLRNRDVAALIRKLGRLSRDTLLPPAQNTEARHG